MAVKKIEEIKGLQRKIHALADLFWPRRVHEWAFLPGEGQKKILSVHISAMQSKNLNCGNKSK